MRLEQLARTAVWITAKDIVEHKWTIAAFMTAIPIPLVLGALGRGVPPGVQQGYLLVMAAGVAHTLAVYLFHRERLGGTLPVLFGLPVAPVHVVLAKYCSMACICALCATPALLLQRDLRLTLLTLSICMFLGPAFMSLTVLSSHPHVHALPVVILAVFTAAPSSWVGEYLPGASRLLALLYEHSGAAASLALASVPVIVQGSTAWFLRRSDLSGQR